MSELIPVGSVILLPHYLTGGADIEGRTRYRLSNQHIDYTRVVIGNMRQTVFVRTKDLKLVRIHKDCPTCKCVPDNSVTELDDDDDEDE